MSWRVSAAVGLAACLTVGCGGPDADAREAPTMRPAPALEPVRLDGAWHLVSLVNGPALPEPPPTVVLTRGRRMRGETGCNTVAAPIVIDASTVRFAPLAVSGAACPTDAARALERAWVAALRKTRRVGRHGEQLVLVGEGNAELARLEPGLPEG